MSRKKRNKQRIVPVSLVLAAAGSLNGQEAQPTTNANQNPLAVSSTEQAIMLAQSGEGVGQPGLGVLENTDETFDVSGDASNMGIVEPVKDLKSRIGAGFSLLTNVKASIGSLATFTAGSGPATGSTVNRDYLDGFVYLDSSDNLGDTRVPFRSHNFGFGSGGQVHPAAGAGTIEFHDVRLDGGSYASPEKAGFAPGFEVHYSHRLDFGKKWTYELELGLGIQDFSFDIKDKPADFQVLSDTYQLGGVDPTVFGIPYTGSFFPKPTGSPKIGSTPTRTFGAATGTVAGGAEIDTYAVVGRIGPGARYDATEKLDLTFMGGITLAYMHADVTYDELQTLNLSGSNLTFNQAGAFSESGTVWGFFGAARATYDLSERLGVYGEVRYLHLQSFDLSDGVRTVDLDFGSALGFLVGVTYDF